MKSVSVKNIWRMELRDAGNPEIEYEAYVSAPGCWTGAKVRKALENVIGDEVTLGNVVESIGTAYNLTRNDLPPEIEKKWYQRLLHWVQVKVS